MKKKVTVSITKEQIQLKERLEYGDITNIARALDISRMTIWNTLNGKRQGNFIWTSVRQLVENRDKERAKRIDSI